MNARFADYVTSGAFSLALTRSQISQLSLVEGGESRYLPAAQSLERKGLIEAIPEQPKHCLPSFEQRTEWRLTAAGALCLSLLNQAGLTNAGDDAMAREIEDLRRQLAASNEMAHAAGLKARSLRARHDKLRGAYEVLNAFRRDRRPRIRILELRDPLPDATLDQLTDPDTRVVAE